MSVALDILRSYARPREVLARRLDGPPREPRALAALLGACGLIFVGQLQRLAREAYLDPTIPFDGRMAGALFGWLMIMPLAFYLLALIAHGVLRVAGVTTTGYRVRMALFWALLASTPFWLLAGLVIGFTGYGAGATLAGALAVGSFVILAGLGLVAAGKKAQEAAT